MPKFHDHDKVKKNLTINYLKESFKFGCSMAGLLVNVSTFYNFNIDLSNEAKMCVDVEKIANILLLYWLR